MNFYSDHLINDIIDHSPMEELTDDLHNFMTQCGLLLTKYSIQSIHRRYTSNVLNDSRNVIAFYCLDHAFSIDNCPSVLVYRKYREGQEIRYYILFTCTKRSFRGLGYASKLLDGFLERIREEQQRYPNRVTKVVLSSLETSVLFYESYGFTWTRRCIREYPVLLSYETYEEGKEYYMMELIV
jgi:ribosomal protein S18 acetylase RimI-like enzyme